MVARGPLTVQSFQPPPRLSNSVRWRASNAWTTQGNKNESERVTTVSGCSECLGCSLRAIAQIVAKVCLSGPPYLGTDASAVQVSGWAST